ncbi:capsule assembly Wzi family protein [Cochleicola gelatinilyticus]|uniref:Capsule assembly Wzi family protein n=1 Tax=Cochleicola gelatinilyticus TaxID=1763537 RepID=A0A167G895_9FLAO|nr:capsule assembly Wzi family protein [Cochleicola gelatinilyticus]OAB77322.1 hypothetical protein ULVI_12525 [Cochleicola gelatinilyticus]
MGLTSHIVNAQNFDIETTVSGGGFVSNDNELPFWIVANSYGAIFSETDYLGTVQSKATYKLSKSSSIEVGAGAFLRNGTSDEVQRDELYLEFRNSWLKATLGSKRVVDKFGGLSVVANNFFRSGNTRALPGLILEASEPLKLSDKFEIDWAIAHYSLNDDRYVDDTRLHYKKFHLIWNLNNKSFLKGGITHYAQWGGFSPEDGQQPDDFSAFIDIFLAKKGGGEAAQTDQDNVLGNHLGSYDLEYTYTPSTGSYSLYHQHPFEDGSGTRLKNFPDGIWGFSFMPNAKDYTPFVKALIIEYIQTTDQSGSGGVSGSDNYFNSGFYRSGFSYEGRSIGLPFIYFNQDLTRTANSRVRGIHFGISASRKKWAYFLKTSLINNLGTYGAPILPKEHTIYNSFKISYTMETYGTFSMNLGYDYSDRREDVYGGQMQYSYSF